MGICEGCHSGCCRAFAVPVTGADIIRLETAHSLSFWDIACRWADPENTISRRFAPQFYFTDEPGTPFVICLRQTESRVYPGTQKCLFLHEQPPQEHGLEPQAICGVYPDRPYTCRAFPLKFDPTQRVAVLPELPIYGREESHPAYRLCPRAWETSDIDPISGIDDLVVAKYEMEFFHELAKGWNARMGTWADFPDFLHLVYSSRVLTEASHQAYLESLRSEQVSHAA